MTKLLVFTDVDSTLIEEEGIDLLAEIAGKGEEVAKITAKAMNGELDFKEALSERVAALEGISDDCFLTALMNMHLQTGAEQFVDELEELRKQGVAVRFVLASGGFVQTVKVLTKSVSADKFYANELEVVDHKLTGRLVPNSEVVDKEFKLRALKAEISAGGFEGREIVAVGDGANDIPFLEHAASLGGMVYAINPKPIVTEKVQEIGGKVVDGWGEIGIPKT